MEASTTNERQGQQDRLLRLDEVLQRFPVGASTWWAGVKSGLYPKGVKVGPKLTCWRQSDVDALEMAHTKDGSAPSGFMRLPEVLKLIPVKESTWHAGRKSGRFPAGVKLSSRLTVWRRAEIDAFIAKQGD